MELTNWKLNQTIVGENLLINSSTNLKTILSINIINNSDSDQVFSLYIKNTDDFYILKDIEIYGKETLIKDDKLILKATDKLYLTAATTSLEILISGVIM